jgi:hypothetical protein
MLMCLTVGLMGVPPAAAYGSSCTTAGAACTFTCDDGDDVGIIVTGTDTWPSIGEGHFSCGTASGGCSFSSMTTDTCTDQSSSATDGLGTCTKVTGRQVLCWSNP